MKCSFKSTVALVIAGAFAAPVVHADKLTIGKSGRTIVHDCKSDGDVAIMGSRNKVTLRGGCDKVAVMGSKNTLRIEAARKLAVSGSRNTVAIEAADKISATGNDNKIRYVRGVDRDAPKIASLGKRNAIDRVASLGAATAGDAGGEDDGGGAAKAGKPSALRPHKPVVCERNARITLDNVLIETSGVAVAAGASCKLTIRNSKIVSTGNFAVTTGGSSKVTLDAVEIVGKYAAVTSGGSSWVTITSATLRGPFTVGGSAKVELARSHVHGPRSVGPSATFVDRGANKYH